MRVYPTLRALLFTTLLTVPATRTLTAQQKVAAPSQATTLLHKAARAFAAVRTFNFTVAAQQIPAGMSLAGVAQGEGTAVAPDKLLFSGSLQQTPALALPFVTVACGPDQYVELGDGNFQKIPGSPNIGRMLFSPDTSFVSSILEHLEQPSTPQATTLNGVAMWHLMGAVPPSLLALLPTPVAASKDTLRAELWIGQQDSRLRQLTLNGKMFNGDSTSTTRTLTFSHFNEKPTFTVPRGTAPCKP